MTPLGYSLEAATPDWQAVPDLAALVARAVAAVPQLDGPAEVSIRLTSDAEMAELNGRYRGMPKPTNVLSFPAAAGLPLPPGEIRPFGDLVLAWATVAREARDQGKSLEAHVSHLLVHGLLHLQGFDHETDQDAEAMERLETQILAGLGYADPYLEHAA